MEQQWIMRWRMLIAAKPTRPGIWRRKEGGYLARVQARDPRSGKNADRKETLGSVEDAVAWQVRTKAEIRQGPATAPVRTRFDAYAASWLQAKVARGELKSAATRKVYGGVLETHLFAAPFSSYYLDQITSAEIVGWWNGVKERVTAGEYSPRTANLWLAILQSIFASARVELQLPAVPTEGIGQLEVNGHRTYTRAQPNSLRPEELPRQLEGLPPKYVALAALGFTFGLRPSSLRPLRCRGPEADVVWDPPGPWASPLEMPEEEWAAARARPDRPWVLLLIRRSHTLGQEVMDQTKTGDDLELPLDDALVDLLRAHVARFCGRSDYLFPGRYGGILSQNTIGEAFARAREALGRQFHQHKVGCEDRACEGCGLTKKITPRAMRRSFYNLTDHLQARDQLARAITGHRTPAMADRYRTQQQDDKRALLAKVIDLAGFRSTKLSVSDPETPSDDSLPRREEEAADG